MNGRVEGSTTPPLNARRSRRWLTKWESSASPLLLRQTAVCGDLPGAISTRLPDRWPSTLQRICFASSAIDGKSPYSVIAITLLDTRLGPLLGDLSWAG